MVEHATARVVRVSPRQSLDRILDELREFAAGPVVLVLDPLSTLFSAPDHLRALDAVRIARSLTITLVVGDPHRTGLALAFGYRVESPGAHEPVDRAIADDHGMRLMTRSLAIAPPPAPAPNRAVAVERRAAPVRRRLAPVLKVIALCLVLVVGGAATALARYHSAVVTLRPAEQSFSRVVPFAVSVLPTSDPNAIQATPYETTLVRGADVQATGSTMIPDGTASGVVTFRSRADAATTLRAGTALKGPRDVSYVLQADVTVPALDFIRGQLGQATGPVRASVPGPAGNQSAGFAAQYSANVTYIMGEIAGGTEKAAPVLTDDDIAAARGQLEATIRSHALAEVNATLPAGTTAVNDNLVLRTATVEAQPASGTQTVSAHVIVRMVAQIPIYKNADFDALISRRLDETVRETGDQAAGTARVIPASIEKSKPVFVDVQGSVVRYFATVSGKLQAIISDTDRARLRRALAGKGDGEARRVLASEAAVGAYEIRYDPSWLPKPLRERMPRDANIRVDVA